jgi:hypothetical protein
MTGNIKYSKMSSGFVNSEVFNGFVKDNSGRMVKEGDALFAFFISDEEAYKVEMLMEKGDLVTKVTKSTPDECANWAIEMDSLIQKD